MQPQSMEDAIPNRASRRRNAGSFSGRVEDVEEHD
jgi:hypothetical protein